MQASSFLLNQSAVQNLDMSTQSSQQNPMALGAMNVSMHDRVNIRRNNAQQSTSSAKSTKKIVPTVVELIQAEEEKEEDDEDLYSSNRDPSLDRKGY